jgi:hypothetical protein
VNTVEVPAKDLEQHIDLVAKAATLMTVLEEVP